MDRRTYLKTGAGVAAGGLFAGCTGGGESGGSTQTATSESTGTATEGGSGGETTQEGTESGSQGDAVPSKVVIGSDIPYRPFEYETTSGELTGFDVDIAKALFEGQLGTEYEFKPTSFDSIIASLNNNNFRIIMSAMTINDKRAQKVDFSNPYFTAYQTVIVRQDSDIQSKQDLKGKAVGVQKGTTGADAAAQLKEEFGGDLQLKKYDQVNGAFQALMNGQVSAVVNDNTVNAEFVNNQGEGKVRFLKGEGEAAASGKNAPDYLTLTVEEYGIAFRKDDDAFRKRVNEALAAIRENGTYDEIYAKYFEG